MPPRVNWSSHWGKQAWRSCRAIERSPSANEARPDRRFHGGANVGSCALRSDQPGVVVADRLAAIWKAVGHVARRLLAELGNLRPAAIDPKPTYAPLESSHSNRSRRLAPSR